MTKQELKSALSDYNQTLINLRKEVEEVENSKASLVADYCKEILNSRNDITLIRGNKSYKASVVGILVERNVVGSKTVKFLVRNLETGSVSKVYFDSIKVADEEVIENIKSVVYSI